MTGSEYLSVSTSTSSSIRLSPLARIRRLRKREAVLLPTQSLFLSSLPPDLIALICSFLLPSEKLTVWPQLSHGYAALLTPACFQRDHVHFSSSILSRLQSANSTAASLLSQLRSLTVMIHSPPHNNSILTLPFCQQLSPPFPSRSLSFLSFMVDSPELCRAFLSIAPSLSGLRSLHLDVGGSRTAFPQLSFRAFPQLRAVKLRLLLSPAQLLSLLSLPRLQSLDLTHCDMDDANAFVATVESNAAAVAALRRLSSLCLPQDGAKVKDVMRLLKGAAVERLRMDGDVATVTREELCGLRRLLRFELHHWVRAEEEAAEQRDDDDADWPVEEERRVMLPPLDLFPRATTTSCLLRRGHTPASGISTTSPSFSSLRDDGDEDSTVGSVSSSSSSSSFFSPSVVDVQLQPDSSIALCLETMLRLPALQKLKVRLPVEAALLSPALHPALPALHLSVAHSLHTLCLDCLFELEDRDVIAVAASAASLLDVSLRRCHCITLASVVALGARSRRLKRLRVRSCNGLMRRPWEAVLQLVPAANSRLQLFPSLLFLQLEMDEYGGRLDAACLSSLLLRLQSSPLQYLTLIHPELTAYQVVQLSCLTRLRSLRLTPASLSRPDTLLHIARALYQYGGPAAAEERASQCDGGSDTVPTVVVRRGRSSVRRRRVQPERFVYCEDSGLSGRHELLEDRAALEKDRLSEEAEGEEAMRMESRRSGELLYGKTFRTDAVRHGVTGREAFFLDLAAALTRRSNEHSGCVLA